MPTAYYIFDNKKGQPSCSPTKNCP